jgi:hypothetical protein
VIYGERSREDAAYGVLDPTAALKSPRNCAARGVIVLPPRVDDVSSFRQTCQQMRIQAFISEASWENESFACQQQGNGDYG